MYFREIGGSSSSAKTNCFILNVSKLIQNKKKHKISPMLILTSLNSFFRISFSLLFDLSLGSTEIFFMLQLIFSALLKCLLASTKTKEFDINSVIKRAITTTTNAMFPKYVEVRGSKTLKNVIMTTAYTTVIPQTTAIAMNDSLV